MFDELVTHTTGVSGARAVDAWARVESAACAQRLASMVTMLDDAHAADGSADRDQWCFDNWSAVCAHIGAAQRLTSGAASNLLLVAVALRDRFPKVGALFAAGLIDYRMVRTIVHRARLVQDPTALRQLDRELARALRTWAPMSVDKTEHHIDALIERFDPDAVRRTHTTAQGRRVEVTYDEGSGTAELFGTLFAHDAAALDTRLNTFATTVCTADPRTREQRRADAMGALAHGAERLACLCDTQDCPATANPPSSGVIIHLIAHHDTLPDNTGNTGGPHGPTPDEPSTPHDPDTSDPDISDDDDDADESDSGAVELEPDDAAPESAPTTDNGQLSDHAPAEPADRTPANPDADPDAAEPDADADATDPAPADTDRDPAANPTTDQAADQAADPTAEECAGLDGTAPPPFTTLLSEMTLQQLYAAYDNRPPGHRSTIRPATLMGGRILPGAIARRATLNARIEMIVHPGQAPPEPRYRPSKKLADFIRCRDMTCRYPGCRVPATHCDLDHTIPWPQGPTQASNLKSLCRKHHLLKTFWTGPGGWKDRQHPNGDITWTTPDGQEHTTNPGSRLLFPELCEPTAAITTTEPPADRPAHTPGLTMPRRKTTRAKDRDYRIDHERQLNHAAALFDTIENARSATAARRAKYAMPQEVPPF